MNRIVYIDWAKFIGLCLVVFCHIPPSNNIFHVIAYAFHIPFFFMVSGMLFKPQSYSHIIKRGFHTLIIPFLSFNLFMVFLKAIITIVSSHQFFFIRDLFDPIMGIIYGSTDKAAPFMLPAGPSWFLLALFIARIVCNYILSSANKMILSIKFIVAVGIVLFAQRYFDSFIWSIDAAVLGSVFFIIGYYLKPVFITNQLPNKFYVPLLLVTILALPLLSCNGLVNFSDGEHGNSLLLFVLNGMVGSLFLLLVTYRIRLSPSWLSTMITGSLLIISLHMFILEYIYLIYRRVFGYQEEFTVPHKLLFLLLVFIMMFFMTKYLPKKLQFLIGK